MLLSPRFARAFFIGVIAFALAVLVARRCGCHVPPTPSDNVEF